MEKHVFDLKDLNNFLEFPSLETILDYVVDSRYKELHKIFCTKSFTCKLRVADSRH